MKKIRVVLVILAILLTLLNVCFYIFWRQWTAVFLPSIAQSASISSDSSVKTLVERRQKVLAESVVAREIAILTFCGSGLLIIRSGYD